MGVKRFSYKSGDNISLCDSCGLVFYGSELRKDWRGFMVCKKDYEPRHPQELIKVTADKITVKDARPQTADVFLEPGDVTVEDL